MCDLQRTIILYKQQRKEVSVTLTQVEDNKNRNEDVEINMAVV